MTTVLTWLAGIGSRRITQSKQSGQLHVDSESEGSDLEAEGRRLDGESESDVTIDDWQNELRTWEVGTGTNNNKRSATKTASDQPVIKPTPAHLNSEDDF